MRGQRTKTGAAVRLSTGQELAAPREDHRPKAPAAAPEGRSEDSYMSAAVLLEPDTRTPI